MYLNELSKYYIQDFDTCLLKIEENTKYPGYMYTNRRHLLESMTHKSASDKIIGFLNNNSLNLRAGEILNIINEMKHDLTRVKDE